MKASRENAAWTLLKICCSYMHLNIGLYKTHTHRDTETSTQAHKHTNTISPLSLSLSLSLSLCLSLSVSLCLSVCLYQFFALSRARACVLSLSPLSSLSPCVAPSCYTPSPSLPLPPARLPCLCVHYSARSTCHFLVAICIHASL